MARICNAAVGAKARFYVLVFVQLDTSVLGTVSTMTFMALPASNPSAQGNYVIVAGTVVTQKNSSPPPPPPPAAVTPIPTNGPKGLLLLMGLLAGLALWRIRRLKQRTR